MTEKKELTGVEKMRKRKEIITTIGACMLILGGVVALVVAMEMGTWQDFLDKKYLTDPNLPISQWKNATFTISHEQINEKLTEFLYVAAISGGIALIGLGMCWAGVLTPSNEELHRMGCNTAKDWKYCPECGTANKYCSECGIKLSRLQEKKKE